MKKQFTPKEIMQHKGCYDSEKVNNLSFINKENITINDILESEIPLKDKLWFIRNKTNLSHKEKVYFAYLNASIVAPIYKKKYSNDNVVDDLIKTIKDFIDEKITKEVLIDFRRKVSADAYAYAAASAAYAYAAASAAYAADAADASAAASAYAAYASAAYASAAASAYAAYASAAYASAAYASAYASAAAYAYAAASAAYAADAADAADAASAYAADAADAADKDSYKDQLLKAITKYINSLQEDK